jgi:hypothetical protein
MGDKNRCVGKIDGDNYKLRYKILDQLLFNKTRWLDDN